MDDRRIIMNILGFIFRKEITILNVILNFCLAFLIILFIIYLLPSKLLANGLENGRERKELINILEEYISKYELLNAKDNKNIKNEKDYHKILVEFEKYHDNFFIPALNKIPQYICNKEDEEILCLFFKILILTKDSANEAKYYTLSEIISCNIVQVINLYKNIETENKKIINDSIEFALLILSYDKKLSKDKYENLKNIWEAEKVILLK